MPLILLGLIVIIGIIIYALVMYGQGDDNETLPLSERFYDAANRVREKFRKGANYTVLDDEDEGSGGRSANEGGSHTMYFPADAEKEKRKRNIH